MVVLNGDHQGLDAHSYIVGKFLFILGFCGTLFARVVHVPSQFETIQEGLDALEANDTLSVALGTYEEAVTSRAIPFTMIGESDTSAGHWNGPLLNASALDLPSTTAALTLVRFSDVRIENFVIMNSHRFGIRSWANNLTLEHCRMDSAYEWLVQEQDSIGATVMLQDSEFRNVELAGVLVRSGNFLRAKRCQFSGAEYHDPRSLINVSSSEIDSCEFSSEFGHTLLYTLRGPHSITHCSFGPARTLPFECAVSIGDTMPTFLNNIITDCVYGNHAVRIEAVRPDSARIAGNTFVRCLGLNVGLSASGALGVLYTTWPTGQGAHILDNTFVNCAGYVSSDDIYPFVSFPALIENNLFIHDSINGLPSISGSGSPWQEMPHTMRNNVFIDCGYALDGSGLTDARENYWGSSSGPYHEFNNPQGHGDSITGLVQFFPWLTDTTSNGSEAPTQIADEFSLTVYPNPFNPATRLSFTLSQSTSVTLSIYDLLGRNLLTLIDERQTEGTHSVPFDGNGFVSGVYFARLQTESNTTVTKLMLLR